VKLDTIIVYNAKWPMEKTILADIQFYGKAACW
jgi:hypothetical protein